MDRRRKHDLQQEAMLCNPSQISLCCPSPRSFGNAILPVRQGGPDEGIVVAIHQALKRREINHGQCWPQLPHACRSARGAADLEEQVGEEYREIPPELSVGDGYHNHAFDHRRKQPKN